MSSVVAELDANLQALRALKPPGVTKSKIAAITALCIEHVASESVLVQKIYTHFKRTPATHKLGVLYVVDSVTRQWVDKARVSGQELTGASAPDGTFAAGVHKMTELLPAMMNDLIQSAPHDQLDKIGKLVDIWERGNTFPASILSGLKSKLVTRPKVESTINLSPSSTPHVGGQPTSGLVPPSVPQSNWPVQTPLQNNALQAMLQAPAPIPSNTQTPYQIPAAPAPPNSDDALAKALEAVIPLHVREDKAALQQQLQVLQQLAAMNVPKEQWPAVIAALNAQQAPPQPAQAAGPPRDSTNLPQYGNAMSSNAGSYRSRSRSPGRRLRDSPDYGYSGQGGNGYRQRSPIPDNPTSRHADTVPPIGAQKWIEYDASLPPNHIKVLSRTLFVGGATCGEAELREIFGKFGNVQTVIAQPEKRHAFIKMCTRAEALNAKEKMENSRDGEVSSRIRSTRWGVGFGPRDCSDYQTGVSVIPIDRLTDADKKWVLTAEYGGTGGKPITTGLVIEEPDIEIGAGVSSKAMSRRVAGQEGNQRGKGGGGGFSGRDKHGGGGGGGGGSRFRKADASKQQDAVPAGMAAPPQVPTFGYAFPGMQPPQPGMGAPGMGGYQ